MKGFNSSQIHESSLQWGLAWWSLIQESNTQPTELTWDIYCRSKALRSLYSHTLLIPVNLSEWKIWCMNKSQFKDPLNSTYLVKSEKHWQFYVDCQKLKESNVYPTELAWHVLFRSLNWLLLNVPLHFLDLNDSLESIEPD